VWPGCSLPRAEDLVDIPNVDEMDLEDLKALAQHLGILRVKEQCDERVLRAQIRSCAL
jgi:hypothetical protein